MLISALCDYYDDLARDGKVAPEDVTSEKISWVVALKPDGNIDHITDYRLIRERIVGKNKTKEEKIARDVLMPSRERKSTTNSEYIEHRFKYIFGYNYQNNHLIMDNNASQSHQEFVNKTLDWIEGLDSPIVNAYRNFIQKWEPEKEIENKWVLSIAKKANNQSDMNCIFALENDDNHYLHEDGQVRARWDEVRRKRESSAETIHGQCAVTGKKDCCISKLHTQLRLQSGVSLICFNNKSEWSYGNENAYNSNISVTVMKKYTYALDYLLHNKENTQSLDELAVVYWAVGGEECEKYVDCLSYFFSQDSGKQDKDQAEKMLDSLVKKSREGTVSSDTLASFEEIDESVTFYILGIKPNASRLSVKFIYRQKCGALFKAIALHQTDMQIGEMFRPIPLWRLKNELKSPKSNKENVDASLLTAIFKSIVYGTPYPGYLFSGMLTRIKTDRMINRVRAGVVKACINRKARAKGQKEELQLALDLQNTNQAYLCGRLFAVLEHLQQSAVSANLNRTIKDAYFSSAASKPALVFPKLLMLSQNHMKKLNERKAVFYNKLIEEIVGKLNGEFPNTLMLDDQGRFMIGYYQQDQVFYQKRTEDNKEEK